MLLIVIPTHGHTKHPVGTVVFEFFIILYTYIQGIIQGIGNMKLPKYIHLRSGTYHYQRDYPTKLKHLCQTKAYTMPLGLFANNATDDQIAKAAVEAGEAFTRQLKLITNSDPNALSATDKDKAVFEFLRKRGLNKGQYLKVSRDSAISARSEYD